MLLQQPTKTIPLFLLIFIVLLLGSSCLPSFAEKVLGRTVLDANTTWQFKDMPYIITGTVLINPEVTLTIEPGVIVKLDENCSIIVDGTLIARGTEEMPIIFTAHQERKPGSWGQIYFNDSSADAFLDEAGNYVSGSVLQYCKVELGGGISNGALETDKAAPLIEHCEMRENKGRCIYIVESNLTIRNSMFVGNSGGGIYSRGDAIITHNTIANNTSDSDGGGIYSSGNATITHNTIANNTSDDSGSGIYSSGNATITYNIIMGNNISSYGDGGGIYNRGDATITHNTIANNTSDDEGGGVYSNGNATINLNTIAGNNAKDEGGGIYIGGGTPIITNNAIIENKSNDKNGAAIYYATSKGEIINNLISNNQASGDTSNAIYMSGNPTFTSNFIEDNKTKFDLFYAGSKDSPDFEAAGNYWGISDKELEDRIYDRFLDPTKGIVTFQPTLAEPPSMEIPPIPPKGLGAVSIEKDKQNVIELTWPESPEADIAGYKLYYDTDPGHPYRGKDAKEGESPIDVKAVTSFTLTGLTPGAIYYFTFTVYNKDGNESGFAPEISRKVELGEKNEPPKTPANFTPENSAENVSLTATLESAAFSDPDKDSHDASQWQITTKPDNYTNPVYDSGVDVVNKTSITIPKGYLNHETIYYWRVRHRDSRGVWSEYSPETNFTTRPEVLQPTYLFSLELFPGANLVSLPLESGTPMTARTFAKQLGATVIIKLEPFIISDLEDNDFVPFIPEVSIGEDGFSIEGGKGYIVHVQESKTVPFTGTAWGKEVNAPSSAKKTLQGTWAFVVAGSIFESDSSAFADTQATVIVENLNTGVIASNSIGVFGTSRFAVTLVNLNRKSVISIGDTIRITVRDLNRKVIAGPITQVVQSNHIQKGYMLTKHLIGEPIPNQNALYQNYPNPFNPETWIPFQLKTPANVTIKIYDNKGRLVRTLVIGTTKAGIYHSKSKAAHWDGRNENGEKVASGVYFYTLEVGDFRATRKLVVAK